MADWLPNRDTQLLPWARNFAQRIQAAPASYFFTPAEATALTTAFNAYDTNLATALNPATRTKTAVTNKDLSRAQLVAIIRSYAKRLQANPAITAAQKNDLQLPIYSTSRTPIPPPGTKPMLNILSVRGSSFLILLKDSGDPERRARPVGVAEAEVFSWVPPAANATPPSDLEMWRYEGQAKRNEFLVDFNSSDIGKQAYIVARWVNARGEPGPVSDPVLGVVSGAMAA